MPKNDTKPVYKAGKYYKVKLAQAVQPVPGMTLRPGGEHRIEGAFLNEAAFSGKILKAVEDTAQAAE